VPAPDDGEHPKDAKLYMFSIGDKVAKCTGEYSFDGTVIATFLTLAGKDRYVVEHDGTHMLHIFSATNLVLRQ
jgi:hypothetical protein